MASRSSLFVNARVRLPGTKARASVISHNVEYVATRQGADRSATPDDLRRAELSERMGLAGYYSARPGSTALFDQDGAVPLREARNRLREAEGSLATWVISVRREEAHVLNLSDKAEWERYCRANLTQALAEAMGVPESSVRWIAAEHENAKSSKHVHVISWSSEGFDGLMARRNLERARSMLTDAGLAPALKAEMAIRDDARSRAVDAARAVRREEIEVVLPPDGRISYAHLRRWHPEAANQVLRSLDRAASRDPKLEGAMSDYRASVDRMAGLKGLTGDRKDKYVAKAMSELKSRQANALLRTVAPDRTESAVPSKPTSPRPDDGPATRRRVERSLKGEIRACVSEKDLVEASNLIDKGKPIPKALLERCPTFSLAAARAPITVAHVARMALSTPDRGRRSLADDAGERAARVVADILMASISAALLGDPKRAAAGITKTVMRGVNL